MRDLGVDRQGARRRRIPVMKQRLAKAHKRKVKLRTLRIPTLKIRLRLHRGGIQPAALWGVEGQGLAPRYRQALRQAMAKHLGHHGGGLLDTTYDLHQKKYIDPADQVVITTSKPSTASSKPGPQNNWLHWNRPGKPPITSSTPSSTRGTPYAGPWQQPSPTSRNGDGKQTI